jgi:hypothetical protein
VLNVSRPFLVQFLEQRPDLKVEDLERTRSLMNAHVRDSLVTGFEQLSLESCRRSVSAMFSQYSTVSMRSLRLQGPS